MKRKKKKNRRLNDNARRGVERSNGTTAAEELRGACPPGHGGLRGGAVVHVVAHKEYVHVNKGEGGHDA